MNALSWLPSPDEELEVKSSTDFIQVWPYEDIPRVFSDERYFDILYRQACFLTNNEWQTDVRRCIDRAAERLYSELTVSEREDVTISGILWVGNDNPVELWEKFSPKMLLYSRLCLLPEYRCFLVQTADGRIKAHFGEMEKNIWEPWQD